jgi:hypothetical protein
MGQEALTRFFCATFLLDAGASLRPLFRSARGGRAMFGAPKWLSRGGQTTTPLWALRAWGVAFLFSPPRVAVCLPLLPPLFSFRAAFCGHVLRRVGGESCGSRLGRARPTSLFSGFLFRLRPRPAGVGRAWKRSEVCRLRAARPFCLSLVLRILRPPQKVKGLSRHKLAPCASYSTTP